MTEPTLPPPIPSALPASGALAVTSFVLGLIAFITGLFIVGGVAGLIGLTLGLIHLKRSRTHRLLAGWGVGLSAAGIVVTIAVLVFTWLVIRPLIADFKATPDSFEASDWIGQPVPEMTLTALDGRTIRTADWKGHPVVVDMWASWHPACTSAVPDFSRLVTETATQGVQVLAVTFEDAGGLGEFKTNRDINYPIVASTNLPAPFGKVDTIPTTFFINADGIIRDIKVGYEGYDALKQAALDRSPPARVKHAGGEELSGEEDNP